MKKMEKKRQKINNSKKKKGRYQAEILGIKVSSTSMKGLLREIERRVYFGEKTIIVTPNPEFVVFARKNPWFKRILILADISIPDGIGLVWAAKILGQPIKERLSGVDLADELLKIAGQKRWRVGLMGARRGVRVERDQLVKQLKSKYTLAQIDNLEDISGWKKQDWHLIFACQGMGKQEKWIQEYCQQSKAIAWMGIGGGLDFLGGLASRAPLKLRRLGLEWLYRLWRQPWRWRRQLRLVEFMALVVNERLKNRS